MASDPDNCIVNGEDMICGALRTLVLADLQLWVNDKEAIWGPISDIGHTAEGTAATFHAQNGAVTPSELRVINEGQQIEVESKTERCRGRAFVAGQLQWVAAFG